MKTIFLSGLVLILITISSIGQSIDKQQPTIKPETDSITVKSGTIHIGFPNNNDSFSFKEKISRDFSKKGDILVFDPGASRDRMPNANVTTPGVHYHLKIIPYTNKILPWKKGLQPELQPWDKKSMPWKKDSLFFGNPK